MKPGTLIPAAKAFRVEDCGAKAVNLARIGALGLTVPAGHVIVTKAFHDNLRRLGIAARASEFLSKLDAEHDSMSSSEAASSFRQSIVEGGIHADLRASISSVLKTGNTYAVRSSAPGEDGVNTSFAGQFDSVLGCRSIDEIEHAICKVWASVFGQRAIAYVRQHKCAPSAMAIILQVQVEAMASGVLFSQDPRDPQEDAMVVEYCDGLGEQLVSGLVTPARGRIERKDGGFVEEYAPKDGLLWTPGEGAASQKLCRMALSLEQEFGCPQDIEFSVDAVGDLHILQSRPITTLEAPVEQISWSNANIAENFPDPIYPMVQSFVALGYGAYFRSLAVSFGVSPAVVAELGDKFDEIVGCHGGRLYYNLTNIHALLYSVPGGPVLAQYFNTFTGASGLPDRPKDAPGAFRQAVDILRMSGAVTRRYLTLGRDLRTFESRIDAYSTNADPERLAEMTPADLGALLEEFLDIRLNNWTPAALSDAAALITYGLLGSILKEHSDVDENELLQGLPGLASSVPVEELWALSREIIATGDGGVILSSSAEAALVRLKHGELGRVGELISDYLRKWGFRSSGELTLVRPTPAEEPLSVLRLLRSYIQTDDAGPAEKSQVQAKQRRAKTRSAQKAIGPAKGAAFRAVLFATQSSIRRRERARMKQALLYSRLRLVAMALGRHRAEGFGLECAEDIFCLSLNEAIALSRGIAVPNGVIAERRRQILEHNSWEPPDAFLLPNGQKYRPTTMGAEVDALGHDGLLTGTPACGGQTRGVAAVVLDVADIGIIRKDQILVTRQTDPGWAAVFFMVKGLVIERGGLLSHGAIIAREYGIPAVIGVPGATKLINDGATIEVFGDQGKVRVHAG